MYRNYGLIARIIIMKQGDSIHICFKIFTFDNFSPTPFPDRSRTFFSLFLDNFGNFTFVQCKYICILECDMENNINY